MHLTSIPAAPVSRALPSFFHPQYVFRVVVLAVTVLGRADAQEKLEGVAEVIAVVTVENVETRSYESTWLPVLNAGLLLARVFICIVT